MAFVCLVLEATTNQPSRLRMHRRDIIVRFNAVHAAAERRLVLSDDGDGSVAAQYVAMRILRRDNYLVAMVNQEVVDMGVTVPWLGRVRVPFTKCFEWNLRVGEVLCAAVAAAALAVDGCSVWLCVRKRCPCWIG